MKQVVTCQEMKSCDSYTIERMGVPSCVLMERAALKVVEELEKRFAGENKKQKILCVCGSGNNGGGIAVRGIEIQMISDLPFFLKENNVEIAILTLPKNKAIDMADILIENGIKAIWNFAHVDLDTPDGVIVENVHLSESLMTLSYNLSQYRQEHVDDEK